MQESPKAVSPLKIVATTWNEKLVLVQYVKDEQVVEWVYDIDNESDEVFVWTTSTIE